jgi:hypothetical protein
MSTTSHEFRLEVPVESASWACREAIVDMGWEVESIEPRRLVTKRGNWGFTRDPAEIEILLSENGPDATRIVLNGRAWVTLARRHLEGELNRFQNAAEVAAHRLSLRA